MEYYFVSSNCNYSKNNEQYMKNGIILLDERDNPINDVYFKSLIKKETSSFIHKSFTNIIVLIGAGASVLCKDNNMDPRFGKTVAMLAQFVNEELKKDVNCFTLQAMADLCKYSILVEVLGDDGKQKLNPQFNLEDFLSDLLSFEKYVSDNDKEKYEMTKEKIFSVIISNTSYEYDNSCLKHSAFINTVSHLVKTPSKLNIVTTNYDTLIEDAAESIKYTVIDGFSFSHRPYFDSDMFEWNMIKDVDNVKTNELENKKNIINLLKLHGSLTWERDKFGIMRKEKAEVNNPIMVFPSSNKYMQSYQDPYFELFTKFQELLKRPNTLLITSGFSFADNHISQMIIKAVQHNKGLSMLVTDYNITQGNTNWNNLIDLMKHNYQISFLKATMNDDLVDYLGEYYDD